MSMKLRENFPDFRLRPADLPRSPSAAPGAAVLAAAALTTLAACGGPGSVSVTLDPGTQFQAELQQELNTRDNSAGDEFRATVVSRLTDGETVAVPAGATLNGRITAVQEASEEGAAVLKLDFSSIEARGETHPIAARLVNANPEERSSSTTAEDVAKIGASAAAGAILGQVVTGEGEGAAVGAAVGGAAGTAVVLSNKDSWAVLPAGSRITVELTEPLQLSVPVDTAADTG